MRIQDARKLTLDELTNSPIPGVRQRAYEIMHEYTARHFEDEAKGIVLFDDRPNICKEVFRPLSV